jgi:hypothetical protein
LVEKPEGKKIIGRPRRRWGVEMGRRDTGWKAVDWAHLAQDKDQCRSLVNTVIKLRVP